MKLYTLFLFESGLGDNCKWARNEEMVDFFAIQFPKIVKVMQDAKCLDTDQPNTKHNTGEGIKNDKNRPKK